MDYKKYSLEKLQDWVHDAMSSDASPHEIYSAIREAVREDYYYHKDCISRATGLLELLSGHRPVANYFGPDRPDYYNDVAPSATQKDIDKDKKWNEWEETYYPEEHEKDKVKKWVLPVEEDSNTGEYFVSFPDDLLEAADLKEGDVVDWVNQGDGSYLLKKHVERFRF